MLLLFFFFFFFYMLALVRTRPLCSKQLNLICPRKLTLTGMIIACERPPNLADNSHAGEYHHNYYHSAHLLAQFTITENLKREQPVSCLRLARVARFRSMFCFPQVFALPLPFALASSIVPSYRRKVVGDMIVRELPLAPFNSFSSSLWAFGGKIDASSPAHTHTHIQVICLSSAQSRSDLHVVAGEFHCAHLEFGSAKSRLVRRRSDRI